MPQFYIQQTGTPVMMLTDFLNVSEKFIEELVFKNTHLFHRVQQRSVQNVFPYLKRRLEPLRNSLHTGNDVTGQLEGHGLTGEELSLKIGMLNNFFEIADIFDYRSIIRKILEMIDIILDSLIDALGAKSAATELKKFIESSLDDI